jgi:DNA-directed RNA polymerase subunit RPC12/RpoP
MPVYCPKCGNEILPFMKTGQLKRVVKKKKNEEVYISYQLYMCNTCKAVYHETFQVYPFLDLTIAQKEKEETNV